MRLVLPAIRIALLLPHAVVAQRAMLVGRVLDANSERPVGDAYIELRDLTLRVQLDSSGVFRVRNIAPGAQRVIVRAIGYDSLTVVLKFVANDSIDTDFLLSPIVNTLATVKVKAKAPSQFAMRLREFDERRAFGMGRFLDESFFEDKPGHSVGALLSSRIPGLRTRRGPGGEFLVSERYGRPCAPQTIVNGISTPGFDLSLIQPSDVIGFEYYTVSTTPLKYSATGDKGGGSQCGTAIFWVK